MHTFQLFFFFFWANSLFSLLTHSFSFLPRSVFVVRLFFCRSSWAHDESAVGVHLGERCWDVIQLHCQSFPRFILEGVLTVTLWEAQSLCVAIIETNQHLMIHLFNVEKINYIILSSPPLISFYSFLFPKAADGVPVQKDGEQVSLTKQL